jgi:hypothetical protein
MGRLHPALHTRLDAAESRRPTAAGRAANAGEWRARRMAACALALATALAAMSTVRSPSDMLKADLQAAGAAIRELGINQPPDHVQKIVAALFSGNAVDVDATQFPGRVVVTLRSLDRITCLTASAAARRIEGRVVIELRGFASPGDCGERNDMAWLVLP